jgi:HlyD family secretion protein
MIDLITHLRESKKGVRQLTTPAIRVVQARFARAIHALLLLWLRAAQLEMIRKVAIAGIGVLLSGIAGTSILRARANSSEYQLVRIERGAIMSTVSASGAVNPVATVLVGSQVSGQVAEIIADFNTAVKKGDVIARIDPISFQSKVEQAAAELNMARANVTVAQANLEKASPDLETARAALAAAEAQTKGAQAQAQLAAADAARKAVLIAEGYGSVADGEKASAAGKASLAQRDAVTAQQSGRAAAVASAQALLRGARGQYEMALATVEQKEAALQQAQTDLERTYIRAPVDGIVISRNIEAGQTVAASLQAPTLYTIAQDLRDMQVNLSIDEADIGRVKNGQRVLFTVDTFPGRTFIGIVSQVRKYPVVTQNVTTYVVIAAAPNADLALMPGLTANAKVILDSRDNVLRVPNAALRFRPQGAKFTGPAVWVSASGGLAERRVELGITDGASTEIKGGDLKEGDRVVIGRTIKTVARRPIDAV